MTAKKINLFFTEGSSDKVYQAQLSPGEDGWVVDFQYGRRGKPLKAGCKTPDPVDYDTALKAYEKLVKSKMSKGYTPEESGVVYAGTDNAERKTDFQPQLLNPVDETEALQLVATGDWLMQTKHDGERRGIIRNDENTSGANRRGLEVTMQAPVVAAIETLAGVGFASFTLDAEDMGDHVVIFDILCLSGEDLTALPFEQRADRLSKIKEAVLRACLETEIKVDMPFLPTSRDAFTDDLAKRREARDEGIVLKRADAPYTAGRPASGGVARKLKFFETATVRVSKTSKTKRSVGLEVIKDAVWTAVGNCTVPANLEIPSQGDLVDVRYLYAYANGSLFQPVLVGQRSDLTEDAANYDQLKLKV